MNGSISDSLVKLISMSLEDHPEFNAFYEDSELSHIEEVNVGVAVDFERGLMTPVIENVTGKSVEAVNNRWNELTKRILRDEFMMADLNGGTFIISNVRLFGVDHFHFDPIINLPQIINLGVGRIRDDDTMTFILSFDHRVVNGAIAAQFLDSLVEAATDPETLVEFFAADIVVASGREEETRELYLLGGLGSCLSLSTRMIADRDGVAVSEIGCDVSGAPQHGPLAAVNVSLRIESEASDDALDTTVMKAERARYVERVLSDDIAVSVAWACP